MLLRLTWVIKDCEKSFKIFIFGKFVVPNFIKFETGYLNGLINNKKRHS